ncbi:MAG: benzylsuccinate synthase [Tenericutes bacterium HGW-Tenericutes-6]|jgi:cytochrome bd-type quinol oxidase subunit 2|nr:MAG: benzylsuccinate synthase [Tenericutes bacterium HGW-Tenericutes-6]
MFKGRSVTAFLAVLFASAYLVYLIISFKDFNNQSEEPAGQFIRALLTLFLLPHLIVTIIAVIMGWIGFGTKSSGFILTSAILYCVSLFMFMFVFFYLVPSIVLGFVGYANQKKLSRNNVL